MSPYEKQREDRIKRNNEVLIQMGILTAVSALRGALPDSKRQKSAAKTMKRVKESASELAVVIQPARRSTRLRGEASAVDCIGSKEAGRRAPRGLSSPASQTVNYSSADVLSIADGKAYIPHPLSSLPQNHRKASCPRPAAVSTSDTHASTNLDEHNLHRIRTMSESALQRRIYTIQRCDKLQSYVETLGVCGLDKLAAEAQQRLEEQFGL